MLSKWTEPWSILHSLRCSYRAAKAHNRFVEIFRKPNSSRAVSFGIKVKRSSADRPRAFCPGKVKSTCLQLVSGEPFRFPGKDCKFVEIARESGSAKAGKLHRAEGGQRSWANRVKQYIRTVGPSKAYPRRCWGLFFFVC